MSARDSASLPYLADMPSARAPSVSFRDPAGRVVIDGERAFRVVDGDHRRTIERFLESNLCKHLVRSNILVGTWFVDDCLISEYLTRFAVPNSSPPLILEHDYVSFPSYPYEWAPEMLYAAGKLTLDLMELLLARRYGLKDATPYNILFSGSAPIFVDLLSVEQRDPCDPTWLSYSQFIRTFIRPLLVSTFFGMRLDQVFRVHRDGLQAEHVSKMCGPLQKLYDPFLTLITIPVALSRLHPKRYQRIYQSRRVGSPEHAEFVLRRQIKSLRRKLDSVKPNRERSSQWSNYVERKHQGENYSAKQRFVEAALEEKRPRKILDVGCNVGDFSVMGAKAGASVVAIDQDPVVVGTVWSRASEESLDILPLVVDFTRPTGGSGWRNEESLGFLDRARGSFDCAFLLAVIHHMLVTERIPLKEIIKLAWELTTDMLIIEFISPNDPMFRLLTRGYDRLYEYLNQEFFENVCQQYFRIERIEQIQNQLRWLYQLRRIPIA